MIIRNRYNQHGFTLIELLAVLSLVSMMVGVAVIPLYQKWISEVRLKIKARQLFNDLQWARNMAMRLHQPIMLCKSQDKMHCGGDHWENGWLVIAPGASKRLHYSPGISARYMILWRGARHVEAIRFSANGRSAGYNGRFVLCPHGFNDRSVVWVIYISQTGRIRLQASRDVSQCDMHAI